MVGVWLERRLLAVEDGFCEHGNNGLNMVKVSKVCGKGMGGL